MKVHMEHAMTILPLWSLAHAACGPGEPRLLRAASCPGGTGFAEVQSVYCGSNNHALWDRLVECRAGGTDQTDVVSRRYE